MGPNSNFLQRKGADMNDDTAATCKFDYRQRERDRVGVWGFGNVSRDVVLNLIEEGLGKEIVFYGRPKDDYKNRAAAWVDDLKANVARGPRILGTNDVEDMAGLDVIFIGAGVPRKEGQSRADLLAVNTTVIAKIGLEIKRLYSGCGGDDLPILVFMGNPVTTMTWVGYKASGFPKERVMGQAGNLDARRIAQSIAKVLGLAVPEVRGIVFGDHGDSMAASLRYFTVGGIPLLDYITMEGVNPRAIRDVMEEAKKGGTHFVNEVGQSASAGPARSAVAMLRGMIRGEYEVQPVVAIIEKEYGLLEPADGLDSMSFGVPAKIGPNGVDKIIELPVDDIQSQITASARSIKQGIKDAAKTLEEKFGIR
jgi:malate dehydrogenase